MFRNAFEASLSDLNRMVEGHLPTVMATENDAIPNFHEVTPNLYRSGRLDRRSFEELHRLKFSEILTLDNYAWDKDGAMTAERNLADEFMIGLMRLPLSGIERPIFELIDKAVEWIHQTSAGGSKTLVHCHRGSDRTGIVIAAYRLRYQEWPMKSVLIELMKYGHSPLLRWWDDVLNHFES